MMIAGLLSSGLLALIFARRGITPGSDHTLLMFDMNEQFAAFYASLRYAFRNGNNFFYSWSEGLGGNYIGLYAYYLASPLSLLTLLWPLESLPTGIYGMVLAKTGLCGAGMAYFLVKSRAAGDDSKRWTGYGAVILLSVSYALMSYGILCSILPMYLDGMILLPFVMLGVRRVAEGKGVWHFAVPLALAILFHYYTAYMIAGFSFFYLLWILSREERMTAALAKVLARYLLGGTLGVGLSMPLLLPVILDLLRGKGQDPGTYSDGRFLVSRPWELPLRLLPGHYDTLYSNGLPALYCGLAVLALAICFFLLERSCRRKLCGGGILLLLLLCFSLRPLYRVWHGFRDPVAYPGRFAFLWGFFLCVLAAEGARLLAEKIDGNKIKENEIPGKKIPGKKSPVRRGWMLPACMLCLLLWTCCELCLNGTAQVKGMQEELSETTLDQYRYFLDITRPELEEIEKKAGAAGEASDFYRVEKDYQMCTNDGQLLGMHGLSFFSSTYYQDFLDLLKGLGLLQYHYKSYEIGYTQLTDSLFGIRYKLHHSAFPDGYRQLGASSFVKLCENPMALPLGYLVEDRATEEESLDFTHNPFRNQELLLSAMTGQAEEVYREIPFEDQVSYVHDLPMRGFDYSGALREITFRADSEDPVYLNFDLLKESDLTFEEKDASPEINIFINGALYYTFVGFQRAYNMYLGSFAEGESVTITILGAKEVRAAHLVSQDTDMLAEALGRLTDGAMTGISVDHGRITGSVQARQESLCLITVPYDDGFTAYVDGERTETVRYADALLAVPVPEGEHEILLSYRSPGIRGGLVFGILSLLALLGITTWERKKQVLLQKKKIMLQNVIKNDTGRENL